MYVWSSGNGSDYNTTGTYSYTENCVTHVLQLTVTEPTTDTLVATSCGMYIWSSGNGSDYNASGTYSYIVNCVTLVLQLMVTQPIFDTLEITSCGAYTWHTNATEYTTSGTYSFTEKCVTYVLNLTVNNCSTTLNVTAFLEGFYTENGMMRANLYDLGISTDDTEADSVEVNLWSATNLSSLTPEYSVRAVLHTNGTLTAVFPGATLNNSYYVALKHRNSLETWSAEPVTIASTTSYDFSTSMSAAFGNGFNDQMKSISVGRYAIYAGDVNQDGTVDIFDAQITENGAANFLFGYDVSDCNGDGSTDLFDLQLIDNNSTLFLFYARPY
jgi:hypothetical protein